MMRNILRHIFPMLAVVAMSMIAFSLSAEVVTQKQARRIAQAFFDHAYGHKTKSVDYVYNGKSLTTDRLMTPFYLFNHHNGGFVVVAADNKCFPILGYSLESKFDKRNIDRHLLSLLGLYAQHVEQIRFDSQIPEEAIKAWQNLPSYIDNLLKSDQTLTTDCISSSEAQNRIDDILAEDESAIASQLSATYTSQQWSNLINDELKNQKSVAIGVIDNLQIVPVVVNGYYSDMYHLNIDGRDLGWYRLLASEVLSHGLIAATSIQTSFAKEETEEEPFTYYRTFYQQMQSEREQEQLAIEQAGIVTTPIVCRLGGGHYTVKTPQPIKKVQIYTLDGTLTMQLRYDATDNVSLNLSALNNGFYFAMLQTEDGIIYGVKLIR